MRSWTDEQLIEAVKTSTNLADSLRKLGFEPIGSHYHWLKKHIQRLKLSTAHFEKFKQKPNKTGQPIEFYLRAGISKTRKLKQRLIKEGILEDICNSCGINSWSGLVTAQQRTKLILQMDHIDGDNTNNRLENLRLLCPNCHSLTPTFCGKNVKREKKYLTCQDCLKTIDSGKRCKECDSKFKSNNRKAMNPIRNWPSYEEIEELAVMSTFVEVAAKLKVTDNGLRKYLKRIDKLEDIQKVMRSRNFKNSGKIFLGKFL